MPTRDFTFTPDAVIELRKSLGLTQAELADKVGVIQTTVSHWEKGLRRPSGSAVLLLESLKLQKPKKNNR